MSGGDDDDRLLGVDRRKAIIGIVLALLLTLGAVAVLGQVTSYGSLVTALRHADKAWLPLCLLGELAAYTGYVVAYRSVAAADGGPELPYRDAAQVITLGLGAYVIGSGAGGLTVDYWAMRRAGAPTHEAARRTLALNTLQAAGLTTLAAIAGAVVVARGERGLPLALALAWLVAVPAATAAAGAVSSERFAPRLLRSPPSDERPRTHAPRAWLHWLWSKLRKLFSDTIGGVVFVRHVVTHPLRYLGGVVGYPIFWLGDFFILWSALVAFGVHLSPARLVVAEATAWVLSFVPLPGGGSGVAEASMAGLLHAFGVPLSQALFAALTYRAVNFWLPLLPALALVPRARQLQTELEHADRTEPDEDAVIHAAE
jgi:uncharacterized membrane protein YbhN (UPF0104 family)